jgi:glycosyltransferase involved in cell wall biosynthesis
MDSPVKLFGYGDASPDWRWIVPFWNDVDVTWRYFSTQRGKWLSRLPGPHWGRIRAAVHLNLVSRITPPAVLTSIGPANSFYVEAIVQRGKARIPHLAWAFNFTDLPKGRQRDAMIRDLQAVERFVVFSQMERQLYADYFGLPIERFHFLHWGVASPLSIPEPRSIAGPYVAALGGEARDYATLMAAARQRPDTRFVVIARPHNLLGIDVPGNVEVRTNLPWDQAWSLVAHADLALIPLLTGETPNGHVTLVGGMHLGKAQIVTDSRGVHDYAQHEENALLVPPRDPVALARAIERLQDDPDLRARLGGNAAAFAEEHCSEAMTARGARRHVEALLAG